MSIKNEYPTEPRVRKGELPNPFLIPEKGKVTSKKNWSDAAEVWREMIVDMEYGGLPPEPSSIRVESLCRNRVDRLKDKPYIWSFRIHCDGGEQPFTFCMKIIFPDTSKPVPAIINGDECWWDVSDDVVETVLDGGCALVVFNRTEMAEDCGFNQEHIPDYLKVPEKKNRRDGLYDKYPNRNFGALAAWAWGYHRCLDALQRLQFIDSKHIAVTGHSRGGKASLLAGATDKRIKLVNENAGCAGGSPTFRYVGYGGETLDIINRFPSWFGTGLRPYLGREDDIPFDQHCLLATIAPRPLLLTYAVDDRWSNPEGMVQSSWAASEVYRFLNVSGNLAFHLRKGKHSHALEDWKVLIDFISWKWQGERPEKNYNEHPYDHLQPIFSWESPEI